MTHMSSCILSIAMSELYELALSVNYGFILAIQHIKYILCYGHRVDNSFVVCLNECWFIIYVS